MSSEFASYERLPAPSFSESGSAAREEQQGGAEDHDEYGSLVPAHQSWEEYAINLAIAQGLVGLDD